MAAHLAARMSKGLRPLMAAAPRRAFTAASPAVRSAATPAAAAAQSGAPSTSGARPTWDIRMLYDGDCPLCMREVNMLRERDAGKGRIDFVDISSPDYDAADNAGISFEQAMGSIHAILPDGRIVTDVEVFRRLYEVVGLGWVYAITKYEPVEKIANMVYGVWAKYRMEITLREPLAVILEKRKADPRFCRDNRACEVPAGGAAKQ